MGTGTGVMSARRPLGYEAHNRRTYNWWNTATSVAPTYTDSASPITERMASALRANHWSMSSVITYTAHYALNYGNG